MSKESNKQTTQGGKKFLTAFFIFTLLTGFSSTQLGCVAEKNATVETAKVQQTVSPNESGTTEFQRQDIKQPNVFYKIAALADRSGSVETTRTPPMTMAQLDNLIDFVREKSGEIALGFVDEDSNQPFLRLRIEPRPIAPVVPDAKNNPFEQEKLLNQYKARVRDYQALEAKWRTETNRRVAEFRPAAEKMVNCLSDKKCRSGSTDVTEAVKRADLFLSEDEKIPPTCVMLLVTDGLETAKPKAAPPTIRSQPHILVVNGSASLGILERYRPLAFEGIDAAVRHITRVQPSTDMTTTSQVSP